MIPLNIGLYVKFGIVAFGILFSAYLGYSYEHNRFMAFKAEVEAVAQRQQEKNESISKQQELVNKGIKNEYEARLITLRNYYSSSLRNSSSGQMPPLSSSAIGSDANSSYSVLAGKCAETTLNLVLLQDWIKEQAAIQ